MSELALAQLLGIRMTNLGALVLGTQELDCYLHVGLWRGVQRTCDIDVKKLNDFYYPWSWRKALLVAIRDFKNE